MIQTIDQPSSPQPHGRAVSVSLGAVGTVLFASDALCALLVIAISSVLGLGAPVFLALVATLLMGLAAGRYRKSFAVKPYEEWYAAGGIAFLGAIAGFAIALALSFAPFGALAGSIAWWALASVAASYVHRQRRIGTYMTSLHHVREAALGSRWRVEQHAIRLLDTIFSLVGLVILLPVFLLIAIVIAIDDGNPVIFSQQRVGRDDRDFTMWKFRTMKRDADSRWASPDDDRITKTGRRLRATSLDELPQLLNILTGSMSLVGPRPEMRAYAERFTHTYAHYSQRHIVRPGLTGWAQVRLVRNYQPEDVLPVLEHDLFYVQYASVQLYMFCLVKTACEVFSHKAV